MSDAPTQPQPVTLDDVMTDDQKQLLATLLDMLKNETGWGVAKIVVVDRRIVNMKIERSYAV